MKTKIGYTFLGILLLSTLMLCFLINLYLGFVVLAFSVVVWWIFRIKKTKVDSTLNEVAKDTGLTFQRDFLKYGTLKGHYRGYETVIGIYSDMNAFGGMGTLLTSLIGEGAFAAMDIRNFTGIRMKHNMNIEEEKIISADFPFIVIDKEWAYLGLPYVSENKTEIGRSIDMLWKIIEKLKSNKDKNV